MWKKWKFEIILIATVAVWGLNFPVIKAALNVMHPHVVNALRFTVSVTVLAAVHVSRQRAANKSVFDPYRGHALKIVGLGLFGFVVYQLCFIIGVDNTAAGTAALIMASAPIWTAVTGRILGIERIAVGAWLGLATTLVGTSVIVLAGTKSVSFGSTEFFGNIMILAASICWGVYTALSKPLLKHVSPSGLAFLGLLPALPILYVISVPYFPAVAWQDVSGWIWLAIVFSGALSTGAAVITWNIAVRQLGSSHTAAFGNMVPVVALVAGYYLLGEVVTWGQIAGGAIVISGLWVMRQARRREIALVTGVGP
ncbi:MAG: DMT family transporter [Rhodothermia bacterium]|nr:DMT family transporter [Rhodothermia bacterium]